jgi:UPF0716 protein FxsA
VNNISLKFDILTLLLGHISRESSMRYLFLLFISIPIVEMWVLIEVGSEIGAFSTIALVFLTATLGLALLRQQGLATLFEVSKKIEHGQLPAAEILAGLLLAIGGALLLTPGFITDAIGFACLLPPSRKLIIAFMMRRGVLMAGQRGANMEGAGMNFEANMHSRPGPNETPRSTQKPANINADGDTLDGEFTRED